MRRWSDGNGEPYQVGRYTFAGAGRCARRHKRRLRAHRAPRTAIKIALIEWSRRASALGCKRRRKCIDQKYFQEKNAS